MQVHRTLVEGKAVFDAMLKGLDGSRLQLRPGGHKPRQALLGLALTWRLKDLQGRTTDGRASLLTRFFWRARPVDRRRGVRSILVLEITCHPTHFMHRAALQLCLRQMAFHSGLQAFCAVTDNHPDRVAVQPTV